MSCQTNPSLTCSTSPERRCIQAAPIPSTQQAGALYRVPSTDHLLSSAATFQHAAQPPIRNRSGEHRQKGPVTHKPKISKFKGRKRTRSVTPDLAGNEDNSSEGVGQTVEVATEKSHTFYIGDIDSLKKFLTHRFDELTLEELRGFVRHWIKLIEPRWIGDWGMYHEMKVSEAETPPWWPQDMIYREPSHLKKEELTLLAVQVMLIHWKVDDVKRKSQWISKPQDVANFVVQAISADDFSSSEGAAHSGEMQKRALEETLSSTFGIAQAYKTHNVQSNLTEGSSNKDPGRGTHHTWNTIPSSIVEQQFKRPRRIAHSELVQKNVDEASGDETEPDDTMTNRYLQKVLDMKPHL